jgi:replication-associated recombination protein RarA
MSRFDAVQAAAKARSTNTLNTDSLARQIVAASEGDARMAYDFLDTLNAHVTRLLQEDRG